MTTHRWLAAVLCGGASRRMGEDKALVELHDRPLVDHIRGVLEQTAFPTFEHLATVGGRRADLTRVGWSHIDDIDIGGGPLGGCCSAIEAARTLRCNFLFLTSCDAPFIDSATIACLADCLELSTECNAVLPQSGTRTHPLPAVIRVDGAEPLLDLYHRGERRLRLGLAALEPGTVEVAARHLLDIDTPEDLRAARAMDPEGG